VTFWLVKSWFCPLIGHVSGYPVGNASFIPRGGRSVTSFSKKSPATEEWIFTVAFSDQKYPSPQ
jgi:hypothetical protein